MKKQKDVIRKILGPRLICLGLSFLISGIAMPRAQAEVSANHGNGLVTFGYASTCNGGMEGAIRYNSAEGGMEFCDSSSWKRFFVASNTGATATPDANSGYFVITSATWDGALGGLAGANAKCLTDLTNNDWQGKTDATSRSLINGTKVRAFMCDQSSCQNATANTTYFFAVSGDDTLGGASFTSDASGLGPGNPQNWAGTNYFSGNKTFWTGRHWSPSSNTKWDNNQSTNGTESCQGFSTNSGDGSWFGAHAKTNSTDSKRFFAYFARCDLQKNLICFVHP